MGTVDALPAFDRPAGLEATAPPEARGLRRDEVRLLVSTPGGHSHGRFADLTARLRPGDVLVVNRSGTLPASLLATAPFGAFLCNLSTDYGRGVWLVEPRRDAETPGPLALAPGDRFDIGGVEGTVLAPYPGIPRLLFVRFDGDVRAAMDRVGRPIRYGYLDGEYPLSAYRTHFAEVPGSAEMPSAARPFTARVVDSLRERGVEFAAVTLHAGVSSIEPADADGPPLLPEPFAVPAATARAVAAAREEGGRVVAVGTTVVRALETAWRGGAVRPARGFARTFVTPERGVSAVDGLLTGFHDPGTTHLAMLTAVAGRSKATAPDDGASDPIAGRRLVLDGYREAVARGYRWHEFGDSHLLLPAA
ncbi:S-adenosylmethionine:tRNA ribosyltransferase-isomerase [Halomarina pelagica]|uniref:S-adenosylmethionine:tRNA ribosyltransferase-isomerase n=1 Tax=Halomarina pelagica TaxID=2961599 RepID=UPI0020C2F101|nr:S-adenosylmethionine:tRNA ribosyltransferase-isomerase [Halomarina sp. BND7]